MTERPQLELRDVHAGYGPFKALFGVTLDVPRGGVLALFGANGAGKTTLARVASGLLPPTRGEVLVGGEQLTNRREHVYARRGVMHIVEGRSVFAGFSVRQNLDFSLRHRVPKPRRAELIDGALRFFPRLADRRSQLAGTLSGGEQRMLALATALAARPAVLICDELSLGLAPRVVDEVYAALGAIRDEGTSMLVVEQEVRHALSLADRVAVLVHGSIAYAGAPDDVDVHELILAGPERI